MGIHSGPCGTAVSVKYIWKPYYFVYGHAVEIAKLMGTCSEPMKIQVRHANVYERWHLGGNP